MEKSPYFFHNDERNLLPKKKVTGKKIIWSNLFKSFKDTISKTNTCFRQHHDFFKGNFSKDSVTVIKTQKSHHKTKFLIICNNPRIASTKTQSIFCNKTSFAKDEIQKRWTFHDIKFEIFEFSWNKNLFQNS